MLEVGSSRDYLKLQDGQALEVTFDLNSQATGMRTRTTTTKDGKSEDITKFNFVIKNPKLGDKEQFFELSNRWVKRCLESMKQFNTITLVVRRSGSGLETTYDFFPPGMNWQPTIG